MSRHKVAGYKLKRDTAGRNSLLRNLATSVIEAERIVTTVTKAKAVRPLVEHMITLAKTDTLHSRRQAAAVLRHPCGARIGADRITISTVGLLPQIERYVEERRPYRLILSLTSAFSEKRERLVPITARYPVPELAAAAR